MAFPEDARRSENVVDLSNKTPWEILKENPGTFFEHYILHNPYAIAVYLVVTFTVGTLFIIKKV